MIISIFRPCVALAMTVALLMPAGALEGGANAAPFLLKDVGADAAAMGGAATGNPLGHDVFFYNPAGLAYTERKSISFLHIEDVSGDNIEVLSYIQPLGPRFGIGVSAQYVYFTDAVRTEFETLHGFTNYDLNLQLSLAYQFSRNLAIGGSIKHIKERIFNIDGTAIAYDVGLIYRLPIEGLSIGLARKNTSGGLTFDGDIFPLPTSTRVGLGYEFPRRPWRFAMDVEHVSKQKPAVGYGVERSFGKYLALRGGYRHNVDGANAEGFTAGLSFHLDELSLDYAYVQSNDLIDIGGSHRLQTSLEFGATRVSDTYARKVQSIGPFLGTVTAGFRKTDIDNPKIIAMNPGGRPYLDLFAAGNVGDVEATIGANLHYDNWDKFEASNVSLALRKEDLRVSVGDFVEHQSDYTVASRRIRGAAASYSFSPEPRSIPMPTDQEFFNSRKRPVNVARILRENGIGKPRFTQASVRGFGGQSARARNVGDRLPGLNGIRGTYGIFEQNTYGAEILAQVQPFTSIALRSVFVRDDEKSLHTPGVTRALGSRVIAGAVNHTFPSGKAFVDGQAAYSIFDANVQDQSEGEHDVAWKLNVRWKPKGFEFRAGFEQIGSKFDLGGNLAMRTTRDRRGLNTAVEYPYNDNLTFFGDVQGYHDNLDASKSLTTKTLEAGGRLNYRLPTGFFLSTGYRQRQDRSNSESDTEQLIQRINVSNEIYDLAMGGQLGPWALSSNAGFSMSKNRGELAGGLGLISTEVTNAALNFSRGFGAGSRFSGGYYWLRSLFLPLNEKTIYEQVFGRVDLRGYVPNADFFVRGSLNNTRSNTQSEQRLEIGTGFRWIVTSDHVVGGEYVHTTDHFLPISKPLEFNSHVWDLKYTRLF